MTRSPTPPSNIVPRHEPEVIMAQLKEIAGDLVEEGAEAEEPVPAGSSKHARSKHFKVRVLALASLAIFLASVALLIAAGGI
jgi:hypothetical protein